MKRIAFCTGYWPSWHLAALERRTLRNSAYTPGPTIPTIGVGATITGAAIMRMNLDAEWTSKLT